jgi:hypothetical protein
METELPAGASHPVGQPATPQLRRETSLDPLVTPSAPQLQKIRLAVNAITFK